MSHVAGARTHSQPSQLKAKPPKLWAWPQPNSHQTKIKQVLVEMSPHKNSDTVTHKDTQVAPPGTWHKAILKHPGDVKRESSDLSTGDEGWLNCVTTSRWLLVLSTSDVMNTQSQKCWLTRMIDFRQEWAKCHKDPIINEGSLLMDGRWDNDSFSHDRPGLKRLEVVRINHLT